MGYCLWSKPCPTGLGSESGKYPKGSFNPKQPRPSQEALLSARLPSGVDHPVRSWKAMPVEKFRSAPKHEISVMKKFLIFFSIILLVLLVWILSKVRK
jgi:hypothetical protein